MPSPLKFNMNKNIPHPHHSNELHNFNKETLVKDVITNGEKKKKGITVLIKLYLYNISIRLFDDSSRYVCVNHNKGLNSELS